MKRSELEYWSKYSDLIVKKSNFDKNIYISIYSRNNGNEEYFSSQQLSVRLNNSNVIILDMNCKKIIHRNFKMIAEVI